MERVDWGPGPEDGPTVRAVELPPMALDDLLARVARLRDTMGVPVQVLRADRVVSGTHVDVAAWHAAMARAGGRARSDDLAVDFLLYVAGDRQIKRALADFGYDRHAGGTCLVVALEPLDAAAFGDAVGAAFEVQVATWRRSAADEGAAAARTFWVQRLGLEADASPRDVEDAVLAAMADLAVARL